MLVPLRALLSRAFARATTLITSPGCFRPRFHYDHANCHSALSCFRLGINNSVTQVTAPTRSFCTLYSPYPCNFSSCSLHFFAQALKRLFYLPLVYPYRILPSQYFSTTRCFASQMLILLDQRARPPFFLQYECMCVRECRLSICLLLLGLFFSLLASRSAYAAPLIAFQSRANSAEPFRCCRLN